MEISLMTSIGCGSVGGLLAAGLINAPITPALAAIAGGFVGYFDHATSDLVGRIEQWISDNGNETAAKIMGYILLYGGILMAHASIFWVTGSFATFADLSEYLLLATGAYLCTKGVREVFEPLEQQLYTSSFNTTLLG